jgi:UDP-3-O-[3-hydroxymyristoyl] glucosamine N-acyltransferase
MNVRVRELAEWLGITFEGDGEKCIERAAPLETAGANEIAFVGNKKAASQASASAACCLVVPADFDNRAGRTVMRAADPRAAFAKIVDRLYPKSRPEPGIHPMAAIEAGVALGEGVSVGPFACIGAGTRIGDRTIVGPGCSLARNVRVGEDSVLHAGVKIYEEVVVGARAVLHAGCVLGADGFGFVFARDHYEKFPQVGRVVIGNDVEIGANSCVDRAALGVTTIGEGTKLDNMVHIAHNCRIGRHVVIAAQTGLAGGVIVEDYAIVGGQVGVGDYARIESRAVVGSGAGILSKKIVHAGEPQWGTPARPLREYLTQLAHVARLPELRETVEKLRRRIEELEDKG